MAKRLSRRTVERAIRAVETQETRTQIAAVLDEVTRLKAQREELLATIKRADERVTLYAEFIVRLLVN